MSRTKTALLLLVILGLYAAAGTLDYQTELAIAESRSATTQIARGE